MKMRLTMTSAHYTATATWLRQLTRRAAMTLAAQTAIRRPRCKSDRVAATSMKTTRLLRSYCATLQLSWTLGPRSLPQQPTIKSVNLNCPSLKSNSSMFRVLHAARPKHRSQRQPKAMNPHMRRHIPPLQSWSKVYWSSVFHRTFQGSPLAYQSTRRKWMPHSFLCRLLLTSLNQLGSRLLC